MLSKRDVTAARVRLLEGLKVVNHGIFKHLARYVDIQRATIACNHLDLLLALSFRCGTSLCRRKLASLAGFVSDFFGGRVDVT